ncbi:hypothetical protein J7E29_09155 [Streptomyces sp. ISL-90]|nr:hypothetical protein [Streptomyces sp. ISL-90]
MPRTRPARSARRTGVLSLAAAGAIALALSGCTGTPEPTPTPTAPTDAAAPIFASDEEALAAAEAAYERYLAVVDAVAATGYEDQSQIAEVVGAQHIEDVAESLIGLRDRGLTPRGETRFDSASLVEWHQDDLVAQASVYLCLDVSEVRVFDASGVDVTSPARDDRAPMQVQFESVSARETTLLVTAEDEWTGNDFC